MADIGLSPWKLNTGVSYNLANCSEAFTMTWYHHYCISDKLSVIPVPVFKK